VYGVHKIEITLPGRFVSAGTLCEFTAKQIGRLLIKTNHSRNRIGDPSLKCIKCVEMNINQVMGSDGARKQEGLYYNLLNLSVVSQSPSSKVVTTEAEESPLLGAVTKQHPVKTITYLRLSLY
jgi:hypothetical protein